MRRTALELAVLMFLAKWMLRATGMLVKAVGRRLPRNVDPDTGKDRKTGAKIG